MVPRTHKLSHVPPVGIPGWSNTDKKRVINFLENFGNKYGLPLPGRTPQFKNFDVIKLPPDETKVSI